MKVKEFIDMKFNNNAECIKALEMKSYLPIAEKKELAQKVVAQAVTEEDGYLTVDEIVEYIYMVTAILSAYTNLEFSEDINEIMREFDLLVVNKRLAPVLAECGDEYKIINDFVNMEQDRVLRHNDINYQAAKLVTNIVDALSMITDSLTQKIDSFDVNNWGITEEQTEQFLELLSKFNMS